MSDDSIRSDVAAEESEIVRVTEPVVPRPRPRPSWVRFLYNQNPFYLFSTCFLLHGSAHWLKSPPLTGESAPISPWPVMGIVGGYVLLMAITAFLVVRWGKVWDDARSMLVIVLLLFVEIAISFDQSWLGPGIGPLAACVGLLFAVLVTEGLLHGLRMRLPSLFRGPYYLLLGLIFLYPAVPVAALRGAIEGDVPWLTYLFSPIAALALLTLLPAIRRGPRYTAENGTPWTWPMYPWTIFVVLLVGVCLRAYSLPQAFDPVLGQSLAESMQFSTVFAPYFLVPIAFAVAVLLLEIGLVAGRRDVQKIALGIPFLCLLLSLPVTTINGPDARFLARFTDLLGQPIHVTAIGIVVVNAFAVLRRAAFAECLLALSLLVFAYVPAEGEWFTKVAHPWAFVAAAVVLGLGAIKRRESRLALASGLCLALASQSVLEHFDVAHPHRVLVYVVGTCLYLTALLGTDRFAANLRVLVAVGSTMLAVGLTWAMPFLDRGMHRVAFSEQVAILLASMILALAQPSRSTITASGGILGFSALNWGRMTYEILVRHPFWPGIRSLLAAALLFLVAVAISVVKAGGGRWLWDRYSKSTLPPGSPDP